MNDNNYSTPSQKSDELINLLELLHIILQGKWLIFFFILLTSLIAFIYAYGQSPIYKADTLLRVEPQQSSIPGIEELAGLSNNDTSVGTELELIKSRRNLITAVKILKLDIVSQPRKILFFSNLHKHFFSPNEVKKLPLIWDKFDEITRKYAWGNEHIKIDRLDVPKEWLNKPLTLIAKSNNEFEVKHNNDIFIRGKVGQPSNSKNNLFSIFVSELTGLPKTEFNIIKYSHRRTISKLKSNIIASEKGKKTGIIALSLTGKDRKNIVKILDEISNTYVEQNKSRSSEEASNALSFLEEQIKPVKESVDKAEANLRRYRTENQTADLPQETQAILDITVEIDSELQGLSLSREELKRKYADQHPTIRALDAQEKKLNLRKKETLEKIEKLPKKQQKLLKLEREIKVSNTIYVDLLNKIQEFKIAKASTIGNAYVVDAADIDGSFLKPNRRRILINGVLLGIILGIIAVFLRKVLRNTINNPEKLEEAMELPVYATVPFSRNVKLTHEFKSKNKKQKSLLAIDNKTDPAIESLRSLRTSLHFALHEAKNNIVMITGPSQNIGKSFIASNFAAVIATAEQRVLLIDADMRKGYLHQLLDLELAPGLSDMISEKAIIPEDTIHTVQIGDVSMDVITHGQTPPNPSELLMTEYFEKLLNYFSKKYDLIIIDTPPVHAVTDPSIIGAHAGVVFMVVHSGHHTIRDIKHAVTRLSQTGIDTKGFIFNGYVATSSLYGYGYGYNSYYGQYK
jgi:tyrosine-protein kinase Etk/Wzc